MVVLDIRISTGVGGMIIDTVRATGAIAAMAGTAFSAVPVPLERCVTFWHAS